MKKARKVSKYTKIEMKIKNLQKIAFLEKAQILLAGDREKMCPKEAQ